MTHEINRYITEIDKSYRAENATEHTYRPALKTLLESITSGLDITNEPKHIECCAPDYIKFIRYGQYLIEKNTNGVLAYISNNSFIDSLIYKDGKVWINKQQYFDKVPPEIGEFYIGGYQPAQKWLKDRKGRNLNFDEIQHYQKIVYALYLTKEAVAKLQFLQLLPLKNVCFAA